MTENKPQRKSPTRERVLDAAERLLAKDGAAFSMRELAEEAGVSFATPFNQFGAKSAIMLALSARRIAEMRARLAAAELPRDAIARCLAAVEIATAVMLRSSNVSRAVMGAIGTPGDAPGDVESQSRALWVEALGEGFGLAEATRALALALLPDQFAFGFRGALSFWASGEIIDADLGRKALRAAAVALLGFADEDGRARILNELNDEI